MESMKTGRKKEKKRDFADYFRKIKERAKESRVYTRHQLVGLEMAELLDDRAHKSLYIKLAKEFNEDRLLSLAKSIAEKKNIKNKGAYFMAIWQKEKDDEDSHRRR
ncbi:MAG TPA: hypothetical protein PLN18_00985 [Candidatus Colwellbacteria bacterium]|nr:hypothetical protein [Candidatus Colwellbacteria bacterium]HQA95930.1 hypothetical protein [Candidatus Colwellbacteria bacterium]